MNKFLNETKYLKLISLLKALCFWMFFVLLLMAAGLLINLTLSPKWERYSYGVFGTFAALIATTLLLKVEKKSFADYELKWQRNTMYHFFKGLFIGAFCFGIMIVLLLAFTTLTIEKTGSSFRITTVLALWYILPMAFMEELAFRAYPFLQLNKTFGLRITQVMVAIAFAMYHIVQGWNIQISILGPGIWAFVFGLGAVWYKGIALPTGIHIALNFSQEILGIKGNSEHAFWILKQQNSSALAIERTETVGIAVQVSVLIAALLFTEYYIYKRNLNKLA